MDENSDKMQMSMNPRIERDREAIIHSRRKGKAALLGTFFRLSGPGWLQSAITLGSGSLSSSLYLGVLVGFSFLWLQPLAMIMGVIMLSAIGYVTLSTGMRPFQAINEHVNPVLGWGWIIACMMANIVWSMPQFALGTAAVQQNLLPGVVGVEAMGEPWGKIIVGVCILGVAITFVMFYNTSWRGVKIFEIIVKMMVGMIVICFFGVIVKLSIEGALDWSKVRRGLIPDLGLLFRPADTLAPFIGEVGEKFQAFWETLIVRQQRDVMISAASTAVGINMTFLLPYSMLRKGWGKDFRGLAIFDLSTGLFIPFILVTGCVVMASASQFHAVPAAGFLGQVDTNGKIIAPAQNLVSGYNNLMQARLKYEVGDGFEKLSEGEKAAMIETMPVADKKMAAMLVKRDAFNLADALSPLTGKVFSRYMFGLGVLGMAINASTMLMLINGLVLCEMFNKPAKGRLQRVGCLMVSVGVLGPFFWNDAKMWLAIPTSVFAMVLLPIAYFAFYMLMNQRSLLGDKMPKGGKRVGWNVLMAIAAGLAAFGSVWTLWSKLQWTGIGVMGAFIGLVLIVQVCRKSRPNNGV